MINGTTSISIYENASFIIVSAETEYISTRSWYRNINFLRDGIRRIFADDVLSINNSRFAEFLPLIYPPELEVKETTDTASSASFLNCSLTQQILSHSFYD
jgi:hypothetical protein